MLLKILWKRGEIAPNFSSFPQYFQYISNFRSQITYSFVKCGCSIYFSSILQISKYFKESLNFEIRRVDCTCFHCFLMRTPDMYKVTVFTRNYTLTSYHKSICPVVLTSSFYFLCVQMPPSAGSDLVHGLIWPNTW